MATHNGIKYLQEQLDSISNQTRQPDELIVCDDCSVDATLEILEDFKRRVPFKLSIFQNTERLGPGRTFERALRQCGGDLIFLCDQDDTWNENKISVVLDCANRHPEIDVLINDAYYTDERLKSSGVTVLQKVISVGGGENGHIAGACTAITSRFCDFILPFPADNCPQHDVYIHRWAAVIGCKVVIRMPLQNWRIHGSNATSMNEMSTPEMASPLGRYMRAKHIDATDSYLRKADEFREMKALLHERAKSFSCLPLAPQIDLAQSKINQVIDANMNRSKLKHSGWFKRKKLIFEMMIKGQYQHFKGLKSIAKDLLN